MGEVQSLAPLPQQTMAGWHAFVASGNPDLLRPLLAQHMVFRSPFVQSPIPGRAAALLVLTTVVQIFENFRYHREFVAGCHDAALEFSANIGKWQLKGIDLIRFDESGEMIDGEPDRPAAGRIEAGRGGCRVIFVPFRTLARPTPCLRGLLPCGKDRPAPTGPFWPIPVSGACCRSSVVEHSIGNGEVDSSILSGSTSFY
jgi:hypothetical protein